MPEEKTEVDKIQRKARWFWLSEDQKLYKWSFSGPYLLCVHPEVSELTWRNYTKGFVEATQEVGSYLIGPSPKATGGQTCRKKHTNT